MPPSAIITKYIAITIPYVIPNLLIILATPCARARQSAEIRYIDTTQITAARGLGVATFTKLSVPMIYSA